MCATLLAVLWPLSNLSPATLLRSSALRRSSVHFECYRGRVTAPLSRYLITYSCCDEHTLMMSGDPQHLDKKSFDYAGVISTKNVDTTAQTERPDANA